MRKRLLGLTLILGAAVVIGMTADISAGDRPEQSLVTIKTYIFSGSTGEAPLSFPMYPSMSMAVLEETIADAETYTGKLKSLYAFSQYRLLDRVTTYARLTGRSNAVANPLKKTEADKTGPWQVHVDNFSWDPDGRLQMMVKITNNKTPFLESHVSVKPGSSVVLGRYADEHMGQAVFVVVAPEVEVEVAPKLDAVNIKDLMSEPFGGAERKSGLPPPEKRELQAPSPCGETIENAPGINDFVAVSKMPELLTEQVPKYPETAEKEGAQGKVWLRSLISKEGTVLKSCVVRSSGRDDLDQAAVEASRNYRYTPALDEKGNPVLIWVAFQVVFALQ